jgi:hypothetical protein
VSSQDRTSGPASPGAADRESQADLSRLSRRTVLRTAAGAGAAGLAASALAAAAAPVWAATAGHQAHPVRQADDHGTAHAGAAARDMIVHLRDARSGEMDIFAGTSQTRLRDPDLAARLARAAG